MTDQRRSTVDAEIELWWQMSELCLAMVDFTPEAHRLAGLTRAPDGFGGGGGERGGPGSIANPTLAGAEKLAGGHVVGEVVGDVTITKDTPDVWILPTDRVAVALEKMFEQADAMAGYARRIAGLKRIIEGRADGRIGRQSSVTDCLACECSVSGVGYDRIKTGYCPRCWTAWVRYRIAEHQAGRVADHEVFRRRQRKLLTTERAS